ncbi:ribonuclease HII [Edhazardia aedis USNM 41457]|uniref:Ribonuclease n=1 Tax=Edhazardia aedis (strain USNM 41457) TaxID=1003232 RepID=J9DL62_EDHAE|nr:ribonuclease HII [Edhazardia aedis USNM 41457]|eukprot:EJW02092.1 ribonuclease HII [Edhazardia aedis USNM 41457]
MVPLEMNNDEESYNKDIYTFKSLKQLKKKVIIGVDEAGRGPALGHMVYGAMIAEEIKHPFTDSKAIAESKRNEFLKIIEKEYSYVYTAIHPQYISHQMSVESLNDIAYKVVINILKTIVNSKLYNISCVYLDALGPNTTYMRILEKNFPKIKFVVECKADSTYPVVAGASIVAKVTRDRLLRNWPVTDKKFGSGYPGDDVTRKWLERNFCPVFGFPNIVRFSWKTVKQFFKTRESKPLKKPKNFLFFENY